MVRPPEPLDPPDGENNAFGAQYKQRKKRRKVEEERLNTSSEHLAPTVKPQSNQENELSRISSTSTTPEGP